MPSYHSYGVTLSDLQKRKIFDAITSKTPIKIRLSKNQLTGPDELLLTATQIRKLRNSTNGVEINLSKAQLNGQRGGSLFSSLIPLFSKILPAVTTVASKALPGLATGIVQSLGSFGMDKILGSGINLYAIPSENIESLLEYKNELTRDQKNNILYAMQNGSGVVIEPTKKQSGGFLGALLAGVGIPMLLKAVTGSGLQNRPPSGRGLQNRPPQGRGARGYIEFDGKKKGSGLLLGSNSPLNGIPLLGSIF